MVAFGGDRIAVTFHQNGGRSVLPPWWAVVRILDGKELATDPKASHWMRGCKTFCWANGKEEKKKALWKALAWVRRTYGRKGLVRNAMGDFVETEVQAKYPIKRTRFDPLPVESTMGTEAGAMADGIDVHTRAAEQLFGTVDKKTRAAAKRIGYMALYGNVAAEKLMGKQTANKRPRGKAK